MQMMLVRIGHRPKIEETLKRSRFAIALLRGQRNSCRRVLMLYDIRLTADMRLSAEMIHWLW